MNLTSSQFVVIDDKAIHLNAISDALNELGGACLKIDYTEYDEVAISQKKSIYNGVRVIFSDLHLVDGTTASDTNSFYSIITGVLAAILDRHHPPYLLILWTEDNRTDHIEKLNSYFDDLNQVVKKPIQILSMSKHDFIDTTTGEIKEGTNKLQAALQKKIQSNIGLNTLYQWDYEAQKAVHETLYELEQLALSQVDVTGNSFDESVMKVLNELAKGAVGKDHIDNDPLQALNLALSPIIQDKLVSRSCDSVVLNYWADLINTTRADQLNKIEDINVVGKYNKLLHLSAYHPNSYQATDLGVVSVYSDFNDIKSQFGLNENEPIFLDFPNQNDSEIVEPMLISISAFCDFAQNKARSQIFYLAGIELC